MQILFFISAFIYGAGFILASNGIVKIKVSGRPVTNPIERSLWGAVLTPLVGVVFYIIGLAGKLLLLFITHPFGITLW